MIYYTGVIQIIEIVLLHLVDNGRGSNKLVGDESARGTHSHTTKALGTD